MPEDLIVCFARLIRCAIVASGTRNAFAISAVVRPPTARSVSAIADGRGERGVTAHEEQVERVVVLHRGLVRGEGELLLGRDQADHQRLALTAGGVRADLVGEPPRRDLDQPRSRMIGEPLLRPLQRGRDERLLDRVLRRREVAELADHRAEHLRRELAQQPLHLERGGRSHHRESSLGALITWRTSIGMFSGLPPGPGAVDASAAIAYARSGLSTSIDPVAGEELLRLGEHAVGDRLDRPSPRARPWRVHSQRAPWIPTSSPASASCFENRFRNAM